MKPATFFLALTLILLFTKHSLSYRAIVDIVYDVKGYPLERDVMYFIKPPIWGPLGTGGVTLGSPYESNGTCVADVIQDPLVVDGTSFTFTPVAVDPLGTHVIELGKPLVIQSPTENPCKEGSTVWKVSTLDGSGIITTGGIMDTPTSCLRITKPEKPRFPDAYSFEYCPSMCGVGVKHCYPIGIYMSNDGQRHLSPRASSIFEFVFKKVLEPAVISEVI